MTTPSTIKGSRTKLLVAPTDFMMLISIRRENKVTFTVLAMMNRETIASSARMPMLQIRTRRSMLLSMLATSW